MGTEGGRRAKILAGGVGVLALWAAGSVLFARPGIEDKVRQQASSAITKTDISSSATLSLEADGRNVKVNGKLSAADTAKVRAALDDIPIVGDVIINGDDGSAAATTAKASDTTTKAPETSTSAAETTTTAKPLASTTTAAPQVTTTIAGAADTSTGFPTHWGVYKGGKITLQGRLPSKAAADKFVAQAAKVLGPQNVINQYVIDPKAPPPSAAFIRVDEPFLFKINSAEIDPAYTQVLTVGVATMGLGPDVRMVITGFTDNTGDEDTNLELSRERAQAVADWISSHGKINPSRFEVKGAGSSNPVADNSTEEGRAKNRRIEVIVLGLLN